jgi:hypothetical protein
VRVTGEGTIEKLPAVTQVKGLALVYMRVRDGGDVGE